MRKLAVEILSKINDENSNSTKLLNENCKNLNNIDNNFLREIVYGTLENRIYLDYIIRKLCKLRLKKFDIKILNILRISIYQLLFMDKVPEFAVLNEAVNLTKVFKLKRFSSFVNGSLRNFLRNKEKFSKIDTNSIEDKISIKYSTNLDLVKILLSDYKKEKTEEILENSLLKPHFSIIISSFKKSEQEVVEDLKALGYEIKKCTISKRTYFVKNPTDIINTESFKNGDFTVQDVASILANDIVKSKLKKIKENLKRLNITNVTLSNFDGCIFKSELKEKFDYVICDVICSGVGVIDRKPEIKLFRNLEQIENIIQKQRKIFDNAIKYLKPNGKIIYSTCSILNMENEENVKYFLEKYKDLEIEKINFLDKKVDYIKLLPEKRKHNGFFIVKFKKR